MITPPPPPPPPPLPEPASCIYSSSNWLFKWTLQLRHINKLSLCCRRYGWKNLLMSPPPPPKKCNWFPQMHFHFNKTKSDYISQHFTHAILKLTCSSVHIEFCSMLLSPLLVLHLHDNQYRQNVLIYAFNVSRRPRERSVKQLMDTQTGQPEPNESRKTKIRISGMFLQMCSLSYWEPAGPLGWD